MGPQGAAVRLTLGVLDAVLVGGLLTPDALQVHQLGQVPARRQALEAQAREREVAPHPEVRRLLAMLVRQRLAAVGAAGHLEAAALHADAEAAGLTAAAAEADLHAGVAVGRLVDELCALPPVDLLGVSDVYGVGSPALPQQPHGKPGYGHHTHGQDQDIDGLLGPCRYRVEDCHACPDKP